MEKALSLLNKECHEAGVCHPVVKHAAELWKDGSPRKIIMCCWEDGVACSAVLENGTLESVCSYCTEPGQEEAFWAFQAHLTSPRVGYKIKSIEVEE